MLLEKIEIHFTFLSLSHHRVVLLRDDTVGCYCKPSVLHRGGAEAARRAHNSQVTGSKPVPGILHFGRFAEPTRQC